MAFGRTWTSLHRKIQSMFIYGRHFAAELADSKSGLTRRIWGSPFVGGGIFTVNQKKEDENWNREKKLVLYLNKALKAMKANDVAKAERYLESALQANGGANSTGVECTFDMLATLAYRRGDMVRTKQILNEVPATFEKMGMSRDDNVVVKFAVKLARLCSILGEDEQAENEFKKCVNIQEKKYSIGHLDEETLKLWLTSLFWYGQFLKKKQRYEEAKDCFEKSYKLCAYSKTLKPPQAMVILYNLSESEYALGETDEALKNLFHLTVMAKSHPFPDLALCFSKIGIIYYHQGNFDEAVNWCQKARMSCKVGNRKEVNRETEELAKLNGSKGKTPK